jgi:hypothetical protein
MGMGVADPRREFLLMVKQMRAAQVDYFRTRSSHSLMEAKRLEREVDEIVDAAFRPKLVFPKQESHSS